MQTQLTHLSTLSQQRFASNERDIPLFEEAFDTVSLRKFFQKQDSTSNTPLTFYSESPVLDDFQLFEQESRSIFSSPMKTCTEDCPIVYGLPNFTLQSELDEGLCTTISGFMEKKFDGLGSHETEIDVEDQFGEEDTETGQLSIDGERKAGSLDNGNEFSVNIEGAFFAQRAALDDEPMIQDIQEMMEDGFLEDSQKIDNWNFESKLKSKTLFIIERNVARKVIEKIPKEKKKSALLEKKKKIKKTESEKEQNKENEEPVAAESLKKKYKKKALTATDSEAKKKDKEAKIKVKKVKEDGDKKVSKKKEKKEKVKTDKSAAKKH